MLVGYINLLVGIMHKEEEDHSLPIVVDFKYSHSNNMVV
jgi:hypothetical protein